MQQLWHKAFFRSDTAGYQQELLRYCAEGGNERFGVIEFAIGADVTASFRQAVRDVDDDQWRPVLRSEPDDRLHETEQQWAEVCYVPSWAGHSKKWAEKELKYEPNSWVCSRSWIVGQPPGLAAKLEMQTAQGDSVRADQSRGPSNETLAPVANPHQFQATGLCSAVADSRAHNATCQRMALRNRNGGLKGLNGKRKLTIKGQLRPKRAQKDIQRATFSIIHQIRYFPG